MNPDEKPTDLTPEELEEQDGEPLPERAAMTVVNPGRTFGAFPDPELGLPVPDDPS